MAKNAAGSKNNANLADAIANLKDAEMTTNATPASTSTNAQENVTMEINETALIAALNDAAIEEDPMLAGLEPIDEAALMAELSSLIVEPTEVLVNSNWLRFTDVEDPTNMTKYELKALGEALNIAEDASTEIVVMPNVENTVIIKYASQYRSRMGADKGFTNVINGRLWVRVTRTPSGHYSYARVEIDRATGKPAYVRFEMTDMRSGSKGLYTRSTAEGVRVYGRSVSSRKFSGMRDAFVALGGEVVPQGKNTHVLFKNQNSLPAEALELVKKSAETAARFASLQERNKFSILAAKALAVEGEAPLCVTHFAPDWAGVLIAEGRNDQEIAERRREKRQYRRDSYAERQAARAAQPEKQPKTAADFRNKFRSNRR